MSQERYEALSLSLGNRNEVELQQRLRAFLSEQKLREGYGPNWVASLTFDCSRPGPDVVSLSSADGGTQQLTFSPGDLARLCSNHQLVLDATLDGAPVTVRTKPRLRFARDEQGRLVSFSMKPRTVQTRLLVRQTCDLMPRVELPEWFDAVVTRTAEPPVRHFDVPYESHELVVTCTDRTL